MCVCKSKLQQGHPYVQAVLCLPEVCCSRVTVNLWPDLHSKREHHLAAEKSPRDAQNRLIHGHAQSGTSSFWCPTMG